MSKKAAIITSSIVCALIIAGIASWWAVGSPGNYNNSPQPSHSQQTDQNSKYGEPAKPEPKPKPKSEEAANPYGLIPPVADFRARITKKFFGTYVSPGHSPVSPERFTGYHTGVDVEYGDVKGDVPVHAIADGTVEYSGWASGYGGVELLHHKIDGKVHSVVYGHLRPSSMLPVGTNVKQGQQIGLLGTAYSHETDGERRNLHFDILKGSEINIKGYVQSKSELVNWIDPLHFYPKKS